MHDISPKTQIACLRADIEEICRERDKAEAEAQALRDEVAALRARVVVPDGYSLVPVVATDQMVEHVMATGLYHDQNASAVLRDEYRHMVEAAPRLNGKAVSEGLLRRIVTPAITTSDHEDRLDAMNELRTLLGEGTEHE